MLDKKSEMNMEGLTPALSKCAVLGRCEENGPAPIPQQGRYDRVTQQDEINGFSHGVGTCGLKQGACKLTLNVKNGVIREALVEVIGCSGMTHSAAMAAEILPEKTLLEALNTDLVCDAINVAMREIFLALVYGRTQTAYSEGGLAVGAAFEDLGAELRSQIGTSYGTSDRGPRYLETSEGYITKLGLDEKSRIIGYSYVRLGSMMEMIKEGLPPDEAYERACGESGRFGEAVRTIDPRRE
jgi:NifU-like protein involved in Fe-S cluster formation